MTWLHRLIQRYARWSVIPVAMDPTPEEYACMEAVPFQAVFRVRRSPLPVARVVTRRAFR